MQISHWISIAAILISLLTAIYLAYKKGDIKDINLFVSPSRFKRKFKHKILSKKGQRISAIGIINFFLLPKSNHRRICIHLYFTVENLAEYTAEDIRIILTYPRKYFDENDKRFFEIAGNGSKRTTEYTFIDDETIQVVYEYTSMHPKSGYQIIHPIIVSIDDCLKLPDINHPFYFDISGAGFSFDLFNYLVSAKNLKTPIKNSFWVINVLGESYQAFFSREKKFLHKITKDFKLDRYIFEQRDVSIYKEGKSKKDVLVVPIEKMKISYSHFPLLKEPNNQQFNFKKDKDFFY